MDGGLTQGRGTSTATSIWRARWAGLKRCIAQIQPDGTVATVSKGTPMGDTLQFYKDMPRITTPYGQSLTNRSAW